MSNWKFTDRYTALLNKAVAIAKNEGIALVERRHLFLAVRAIAPRMFNRLTGCKHLTFADKLPLGATIEDKESERSFSSETYRVLAVQGGVLGEVLEACGSNQVDIQHVGAALLLDTDDSGPVAEVMRANGINPLADKLKIIDAVKKMSRLSKRSNIQDVIKKVSIVRQALLNSVIGQTTAINQICDALFGFWRTPREERDRPLSIFLAASPGTGKTFLANELMGAVVRVNKLGCEGLTLNGALYGTEQEANEPVGCNKTWKGPHGGAITKPVYENPGRPICIDNIDRIHPRALTHILNAIGEGTLRDEYLEKDVDFRDSIIICLSSAGCDFCSDGDSGTSMVGGAARARIAEEMCIGIESSDARKNVQALVEQCSVVVKMHPFDVEGVRALMHRTVEHEFGWFKNSFRSIQMDANVVSDLLVQTIPSLDARALPSIVADVVAPLRMKMLESPLALRCVKTLKVEVKGAPTLDLAVLEENLHMRKRMTVKSSLSVCGMEATLTIEATGYILLPAITDGIVSVAPPSAADSFERLVGISAPLDFAMKLENYISGKTAVKPEGVLLVGPPGCGKTSFLRALASYIGKPYVVLNCNDLCSPSAVISAFSSIRKYSRDGILVLLDEIDAVGAERDGKGEGYIERQNLILQMIDGFTKDPASKIIYIGATNRVEALDDAITRAGRFGQTIVFSPLEKEDRRRLIKMTTDDCGISFEPELVEFMSATTENLAPATIQSIVRDMALSTAASSASKSDYLKSRHAVVEGIFSEAQALDDDDAELVAQHEAGHAILCVKNGRKFVQTSILPHGERLGFVEQVDAGLKSATRSGLVASIDIALAGRAAQEILGQASDGAINDLDHATQYAIRYIAAGFSKEYGLGIPPGGLKWAEVSPIVKRMLDERYAHVKKYLNSEKVLLKRFASLLKKKKVVFQDELVGLIQETRKERNASHG